MLRSPFAQPTHQKAAFSKAEERVPQANATFSTQPIVTSRVVGERRRQRDLKCGLLSAREGLIIILHRHSI